MISKIHGRPVADMYDSRGAGIGCEGTTYIYNV